MGDQYSEAAIPGLVDQMQLARAQQAIISACESLSHPSTQEQVSDGWVDEWMDGLMDGWVDAWMCGCVNAWMCGWMDGCVDGRMDDHEILLPILLGKHFF